jgi:hypothetical protein
VYVGCTYEKDDRTCGFQAVIATGLRSAIGCKAWCKEHRRFAPKGEDVLVWEINSGGVD